VDYNRSTEIAEMHFSEAKRGGKQRKDTDYGNLFMVYIRTIAIFQTSNVQREDNSQ
jgi:hypothetical protein